MDKFLTHPDGSKAWYRNGLLHREDGPAFICNDGKESWYRHGRLHREGGEPAVISNEEKGWWLFGKRHRTNGPAYTLANKNGYIKQIWYWQDKIHRVDGPALIIADVSLAGRRLNEWWIHGIPYNFNEFLQKIENEDIKIMLALRYA